MAPKISVIIPCYNVPKDMLFRSVQSVLCQTMEDFELIIVDDGSNQPFQDTVDEVSRLDDRIRLLQKENGGVSSARNLGIREARGNYIVFVDADDYAVPYFLQEAYQIIEDSRADFVIGGIQKAISTNVEVVRYNDPKKNFFDYGYMESAMACILGIPKRFDGGTIEAGPWARIVKKEIAEQIPFDEQLPLNEDKLWNLEVLLHSKRVCFVEQIWYLYLENSASAVNKYNKTVFGVMEAFLYKVQAIIPQENDLLYNALIIAISESMRRGIKHSVIHRQCDMTVKEKKEVLRKLYHDEPWIKLREQRFWNLADKKNKEIVLLYKYHCLLPAMIFRSRTKKWK